MDGQKNGKYKGLRIATVYGQGIEGCGVTRTTVELELWAVKTKAIVHTYALSLKKYTRTGAHEIKNLHYFDTKEILETAKKINEEYDIVMFMNYPHNKFPHEVIKSFYYNFFEIIQKPIKVTYFHEIHKQNLDKIGYLVPMLVNTDVLFHFDTDTWFSKTVDEMGIQKIDDRLHKYTLWMNFDDLDRWRQRYLNKKKKGLVSVTRWSSLKNIRRSIDIMEAIQNLKPEWHCEVYGVERSIGAKFDILDYDKTIYVNANGNKDNEEFGSVHVNGPVVRNDGVDIVASHMFSSSFFSLPKAPQNYGNRMEYTQIEIIGAGTIPVFDKHWAENNVLTDGRKYIDIPYSSIYTDGTDVDDVAQTLINIAEDKELMKKYLDTSYELVVQEFGADTVIPKAIDLIQKVGKNKNQKSVYEVCEMIVNVPFAEGIQKLEDDGKLPVLGIGEFQTPTVEYLDGAKQVLVKKIKKSKGGKPKNLF